MPASILATLLLRVTTLLLSQHQNLASAASLVLWHCLSFVLITNCDVRTRVIYMRKWKWMATHFETTIIYYSYICVTYSFVWGQEKDYTRNTIACRKYFDKPKTLNIRVNISKLNNLTLFCIIFVSNVTHMSSYKCNLNKKCEMIYKHRQQ